MQENKKTEIKNETNNDPNNFVLVGEENRECIKIIDGKK